MGWQLTPKLKTVVTFRANNVNVLPSSIITFLICLPGFAGCSASSCDVEVVVLLLH